MREQSIILILPFLTLLPGCSDSGGNNSSPTSSDVKIMRARINEAVLKRHGFRSDEKGFYDIDMISFGDLCSILGCKLSDFQHIPSTNWPASGSEKEYDAGDIRAIAYFSSVNEFLDENVDQNPEFKVKATVIIYDKENPRPVIKRVISKPGEKPRYEYGPRPKPKP